jgi:hypothetical protein
MTWLKFGKGLRQSGGTESSITSQAEHNYVRHRVEMDIGRNGFRAWWFKTVPDNFKSSACGWSGLPEH